MHKMAIPMKSVLGSTSFFISRPAYTCSFSKISARYRNKASWTKFFKKDDQPEELSPLSRKIGPEDGPSTASRLDSLRKKEGLVTVRGYSPPEGVADRITAVAQSLTGQGVVDQHMPLTDRKVKFQLLTRLMSEFDHFIPNTELNNLHTLDDIIAFFSTPVKDRSSYEDMAKLDLPPNLHIQMEPVRFEAETDKFFDGKNAFPGRGTVISSLKFRRKYKGNEGESRNQSNRTRFEEMAMHTRRTKI